MLSGSVGVADGEKVRSALGEKEDGRDDHRFDIAAADLLAIFEHVHVAVRDTDGGCRGVKGEAVLIADDKGTGGLRRQLGERASHVMNTCGRSSLKAEGGCHQTAPERDSRKTSHAERVDGAGESSQIFFART